MYDMLKNTNMIRPNAILASSWVRDLSANVLYGETYFVLLVARLGHTRKCACINHVQSSTTATSTVRVHKLHRICACTRVRTHSSLGAHGKAEKRTKFRTSYSVRVGKMHVYFNCTVVDNVNKLDNIADVDNDNT